MNLLRTILLTAVAFFFASQDLHAQKSKNDRNQHGIALLQNDLGASHETATEVIEIMEAHRKKVRELLKDSTMTDESRRAEMHMLMTARNTKLRALLPPEYLRKVHEINMRSTPNVSKE